MSPKTFTDDDVLAAWRLGIDTYEMARIFGQPEAEMYSRLHRILEEHRPKRKGFEVVVVAGRDK